MNKSDLIAQVAKDSGVSQAQAAKIVDALFTVIKTAVKKGEKVTLIDLGTFYATQREATTGRNPRTGEPIKIAASTQPKFRPSKAFKDAVNSKK